jgi:hypothetical protein
MDKNQIADFCLSSMERCLSGDQDGYGLPNDLLAEAQDALNELRGILEGASFILRNPAVRDYRAFVKEQGVVGALAFAGFKHAMLRLYAGSQFSGILKEKIEDLYHPGPTKADVNGSRHKRLRAPTSKKNVTR